MKNYLFDDNLLLFIQGNTIQIKNYFDPIKICIPLIIEIYS